MGRRNGTDSTRSSCGGKTWSCSPPHHFITASHASYVSLVVTGRFLASRRTHIFAALSLLRGVRCDATIGQKTQTSIRHRVGWER